MSEIRAIFEKLRQEFLAIDDRNSDTYKLFFSQNSMGFTKDDFLFLKSSSGSTENNIQDFYDEAAEFAMVANNIPRNDSIVWHLSRFRFD